MSCLLVLADFVAHASNINCLVLSPSNGRLLATGGDDRKINLWSPGKPNNVLSISGITSPVQSVAFNNAENWIGAGSKSGVIKVFDLDEKKSNWMCSVCMHIQFPSVHTCTVYNWSMPSNQFFDP